jgi:hypothetical protein
MYHATISTPVVSLVQIGSGRFDDHFMRGRKHGTILFKYTVGIVVWESSLDPKGYRWMAVSIYLYNILLFPIDTKRP